MLAAEPNADLLLPPRTRLLHIGPMKTGTTSIQAAANRRRAKLLENGVRYPGVWFNHARQLGALMGWSVDTWKRFGPLRPDLLDVDSAGVPQPELWDEFMAEIDADQENRIFITHEFVSQADDRIAARMVDALGERTHVCLTLRSPGQIVPSLWAQGIRDDAQTEPFNAWLDRFYGRDADHPMSARFRRAYDQAELVQRWAALVGPENVTVVIVDVSDPSRLTGSFEAMLGLPAGLLSWGRGRTNRSLTAPEVELFRAVNAHLRDSGADWLSYYDLIRKGAILHGAQRRKLGAGEPRVLLPDWAARIAERDGQDFAERIGRSGVRVVGDLAELGTTVRSADWPEIDTVPVDLAAPAIAAAVMAAQTVREKADNQLAARSAEVRKLERRLAELTHRIEAHEHRPLARHAHTIPPDQRPAHLAESFGVRDLAAALKRRLRRRLRQRLPTRLSPGT